MNKKVLAFTGAGISKSSGIPTFEEMKDLRKKLTRRYWRNYPQEFFRVLYEISLTIEKAKPNPAHLALAKYNIPIITMNIDGLHKKAGSKNILEIHGNLNTLVCNACNNEYDYSILKDRYTCSKCQEVLDTYIVLYGDKLKNMKKGFEMVKDCDCLLIIGTSYYTSTAIDIYHYGKSLNKTIVEINSKSEVRVSKILEEMFNR